MPTDGLSQCNGCRATKIKISDIVTPFKVQHFSIHILKINRLEI